MRESLKAVDLGDSLQATDLGASSVVMTDATVMDRTGDATQLTGADRIRNSSIVDETVARELAKARCNHMEYMADMEQLNSTLLDEVLAAVDGYDYDSFTDKDVMLVLNRVQRGAVLTPRDFGALLSPASLPHLETIAQWAKRTKEAWFGNSISLFTPLYLANYCENYCIYCGFNCHNTIRRAKLNMAEIETEL